MSELKGKVALIMGVLNKDSIATAIAQAMYREGAELYFTYQAEPVRQRVESVAAPLVRNLQNRLLPCDVTSDQEIVAMAQSMHRATGRVDILVHSLAFAPREALQGRFTDVTTRAAFTQTLDISAYSLIAVASATKALMPAGSSIITMTYVGSNRVIPNYNVMGVAKAALETSVLYLAADLGRDGIRVNAISSGPQNTLAARGIAGFKGMLSTNAERTALGENVDQQDVANLAAFLASDRAKKITGGIHYVDAGQNIIGLQEVTPQS